MHRWCTLLLLAAIVAIGCELNPGPAWWVGYQPPAIDGDGNLRHMIITVQPAGAPAHMTITWKAGMIGYRAAAITVRVSSEFTSCVWIEDANFELVVRRCGTEYVLSSGDALPSGDLRP